jgi:hypothetical protein
MNIKKDIRLDLISLDAGTQQRPLDEGTISRYMALMADGVEFPPIEVVSDGPNFWLWDGFHRLECAKRRGDKTIAAYVTEGTLRNAIWLSFGANKTHGLPRQKGVAKKIITEIFNDKSWSKKSLTAIARHTGVTRQYVTKIRDELTQAHGATRLHDSEDENGDSEPKTAQRAEEVEVERGGTKYKQKSQEKKKKQQKKQQKADGPPKDMAGRIIPEHLQSIYEGRKLISGFIRDLDGLKNSIMHKVDDHDPVLSLLRVTAFQAVFGALRQSLKSSMPYAVCVYCGGEDSKNCKACNGFGFLNKDSYNAAPKELKL